MVSFDRFSSVYCPTCKKVQPARFTTPRLTPTWTTGPFVGWAGRGDDQVGWRRNRHNAEERPKRQLDAAGQERDLALRIGLDNAREDVGTRSGSTPEPGPVLLTPFAQITQSTDYRPIEV